MPLGLSIWGVSSRSSLSTREMRFSISRIEVRYSSIFRRSDGLGGHLVNRNIDLDIRRCRRFLPWSYAREVSGARACMVAAHTFALQMRQARQDHHVFAERLERLQDAGELEVHAQLLGRP